LIRLNVKAKVADNSSRGIVIDLMGTTLDFPTSNVVVILPEIDANVHCCDKRCVSEIVKFASLVDPQLTHRESRKPSRDGSY